MSMARYRVLFVCMGNICRSPAGEGVLRRALEEAGLAGDVDVESAGTIDYHEGELPDRRMRDAAQRRGYVLDSRARAISRRDLDVFDMILVADEENMQRVARMASSDSHRGKLSLMLDWHPVRRGEDVPDPYYGGPQGFEHVLDLLEQTCPELLAHIRARVGG